ncbi:MAG: CerR family C-terminal domain-containing protein [Pirellulaceae bacterium]
MNDESTRKKILMTAGPIFAERGFQGATVRDISEAAEVNLASINYYFGDKQKLYVEVIRAARDSQGGSSAFEGLHTQVPPAILLEKFINVLLKKLGIGVEPDWKMQLLVSEFLSPGEACKEIVEEYFRPYFELLLGIIDRLAGGNLSDAERLRMGFSLIGQCLHYRLAGPIIRMFVNAEQFSEEFDNETLAKHIARFTIGGVKSLVEQSKASTVT